MAVIKDADGKKKSVCIKCGAELKWGRFAHNQDICWSCFAQTTREILERINKTCYPSWLWDKVDEHHEQVSYMMAVVAEIFGEEW